MFDPTSSKVIISRNVTFNEEAKWNWSSDTTTEVSLEVPDVPDVLAPTPVSIDHESSSIDP